MSAVSEHAGPGDADGVAMAPAVARQGVVLEAAAVRTVLVVDDFPAMLAWVTRAFTRAGWTVLTATDSREAMERWHIARGSGAPVGVLITDVELPDLGGTSLVERLRADDADLPVLALHTGKGDAVSWPATQLNQTAFFRKPVRAGVLLETATALLSAREQSVSAAGDESCPIEPSLLTALSACLHDRP